MNEQIFFTVIMLGSAILVGYSILKEFFQPPAPVTRPPAPANTSTMPAPYQWPVQSPAPPPSYPPGAMMFPILPAATPAPGSFYPPQTTYPAPYPGGNGRPVDPQRVNQVMAILDEIERRQQWNGRF